MKLIVVIPDGWEKTSDKAAVGELIPHAITYSPAGSSNGDEEESISINIWPATPNTKPFPDGYLEKLAASTFQLAERNCATRPQKPFGAANLINGLPVAAFFSECWIKSELLKAHPDTHKSFHAESYFASVHDRTMLYVSHDWQSNEYGRQLIGLSANQISALAQKSNDVMSLITRGVKLCNLSKKPVTCTSMADEVRARHEKK